MGAKGESMVTRYWQLDAYKLAKEGRERIFELSKKFPLWKCTNFQIKLGNHPVLSVVISLKRGEDDPINSTWPRARHLKLLLA
jgi:hypothetical protein